MSLSAREHREHIRRLEQRVAMLDRVRAKAIEELCEAYDEAGDVIGYPFLPRAVRLVPEENVVPFGGNENE